MKLTKIPIFFISHSFNSINFLSSPISSFSRFFFRLLRFFLPVSSSTFLCLQYIVLLIFCSPMCPYSLTNLDLEGVLSSSFGFSIFSALPPITTFSILIFISIPRLGVWLFGVFLLILYRLLLRFPHNFRPFHLTIIALYF